MSAIIRRRGIIGADEPILWLYKDGELNQDITGGLMANTNNVACDWMPVATYGGNPVITYNASNIEIFQYKRKMGSVYTVNSIDLSNYKTLKVVCNIDLLQTGDTRRIWIGFSASKSGSPSIAWRKDTFSGRVTATSITLDISALTGNYFFSINTGNCNKTGSDDLKFTISKIWLEK